MEPVTNRNCVRVSSMMLDTLHIFPRYAGDGFGWTYGSEEKTVNSEIAGRIGKQINIYHKPDYEYI